MASIPKETIRIQTIEKSESEVEGGMIVELRCSGWNAPCFAQSFWWQIQEKIHPLLWYYLLHHNHVENNTF